MRCQLKDPWRRLTGRQVLCLLLCVAIGLKVALLLTSQSLADGDEAVEGVMAVHVLERGVHPIYPYGVRYGAGTGVEVHLAALFFGVFGVSDTALKAVGLLLWLLCLVLLYAVAGARYGPSTALLAAALYGFSPQGAQWSLKVAGGHQVAVLGCLAILWVRERKLAPALAAALIPLAAFAHPIALPLAGYLALDAVVRADGLRRRLVFLAWLAGFSLLAMALLWPGEGSVWNPAAARFQPGAILAALPRLAVALFTPNLNSRSLPPPAYLLAAAVWLVGFALATVFAARHDRPLLGLILSAAAVVVLVDPALLVPRHLLVLYPLSCLALARVSSALPSRWQVGALAGLLLSGGLIQANEMRSPCVYGPAPQDVGLRREQVHAMVRELESRGVRHVYCLDPMLQWNILFESRERVLARWRDPRDRLPEYPRRVDAARRAGQPTAVIYELESPGPLGEPCFAIAWNPNPALLEQVFAPAPAVESSRTEARPPLPHGRGAAPASGNATPPGPR